jgi:tetratricopeptide (TPR) repeat protein
MREGVRIFAAWYGPDHHRTANAQSVLAGVLVQAKQYAKARPLLEHALAVQTRTYGPDHRRIASTVHRLGGVAYEEGDLAAAESSYARAATIYRALHGNEHPYVGIALGGLANVAYRRGDHRRAETYLREAIAISVATLEPDHVDLGIHRIKLGRILAAQRRWAEAERELVAGRAIVEKQSAPSSPWLAMAREELATVQEALGRAGIGADAPPGGSARTAP